MFEYQISYYNIAYFIDEKQPFMVGTGLPTDPNPGSFDYNTDYMEEITRFGSEGWELVSVQPLLRGCYNDATGVSYSLTAGYYMFWKRLKS